jgi:hypothetical protein
VDLKNRFVLNMQKGHHSLGRALRWLNMERFTNVGDGLELCTPLRHDFDPDWFKKRKKKIYF